MNHEPGIRYGLIKSSPVLATGEIIAVELVYNDYRSIVSIVYQFNDDRGQSHTGLVHLKRTYVEAAHAVGRKIDVEYFKYDPRIFFAKEQLDREQGVFFAFIGSLVAMALLIWALWRTFHSVRHFKAVSRSY